MQVPYDVYIIIRVDKNGHEDTDGMEFTNLPDAQRYLNHLTTTLNMETLDRLYIDKVRWLYETK